MKKNLKFIIPIILLIITLISLIIFIVIQNNSNNSNNDDDNKAKTSKIKDDDEKDGVLYSLNEKATFRDVEYYVDKDWKMNSESDVNYYYFDNDKNEVLMIQSQDISGVTILTEDSLSGLIDGIIGEKGKCFSSEIKTVKDRDYALIDAVSSDNTYMYCYLTIHNSVFYTFGIGKKDAKISDEHKELLDDFVKKLTFSKEKNNINNTSTGKKKNTYTLGDTFLFDGLEITLGNAYNFTSVNNEYSEFYGKTIIQLPVTITNKTDDTHGLNMFYYTFYGASGTEVDNVSAYFDDDTTVEWSGDLRSGATATRNFYIEYDSDGTYSIEFNNYSTKINVEFDVQK